MKLRIVTAFAAALLWAGFFSLPVLQTGCQQAPSQRVVQYQTLRAAGESAQTALRASAQLLKQGSITVEQWQKVADIYDNKFQVVYRAAVISAQSDLSSVASPDVVAVLNELLLAVSELHSNH